MPAARARLQAKPPPATSRTGPKVATVSSTGMPAMCAKTTICQAPEGASWGAATHSVSRALCHAASGWGLRVFMLVETPPARPTHRWAMNSSAPPGPRLLEPRQGGPTVSLPDVVDPRGVAGRPQGAAGQGEGADPGARRAQRRAAHAADGRDRQAVRVRGPRRRGDAARPLRGPPTADRRPLHVRPRAGRTGARAARRAPTRCRPACSPPARPRDVAGLRRPGAAGQDRALQGQAGLDVPVVLVVRQRLQLRLPRHARRVGGARGVQLPHARGAPRARARRTTSRAISRSSCRARATSCATATASSTPTRRSGAAAR